MFRAAFCLRNKIITRLSALRQGLVICHIGFGSFSQNIHARAIACDYAAMAAS
jgi:hypothetical protein